MSVPVRHSEQPELQAPLLIVIPSEDARSRSARAPQSRDLVFHDLVFHTSRRPNPSSRDSFVRSATFSFRGGSALVVSRDRSRFFTSSQLSQYKRRAAL